MLEPQQGHREFGTLLTAIKTFIFLDAEITKWLECWTCGPSRIVAVGCAFEPQQGNGEFIGALLFLCLCFIFDLFTQNLVVLYIIKDDKS